MKLWTDEVPARLSEGEGPVAELLRRFTRQQPQAPGENAAWDGTLARMGRDAGGHRGRLIFALVLGAVTGAAALYLALFPHPRLFATSHERAPVASPSPVAGAPGLATAHAAPAIVTALAPLAPLAETPQIQLGRAAVGLPIGAAALVGEADVILSPEGSARAFTTPAAATVELAAGALDLHVEKRRAGADHTFEVQAGPYHFTVLGTVFRVAHAGDDVTLSVTEGRVAVSQGGTALAVITAGGFWSGTAGGGAASPRRPEAAPVVDRSQSPSRSAPGRLVAMRAPARDSHPAERALAPGASAPSPAGEACAARAAAGDAAGAADCFTTVASGVDLGAEVALYQAARLYRDSLGQPERAVATLQEARRRFPTGALSTEVSLSLAELLPALGRYREALDETGAMLRRQPGAARAAELHLLRGNVLRAGLHDCAAAEKEYAAAGPSRDERVADGAAFWNAVCLAVEHRRPEARAAFAQYLTRPHAAHAAAAWENIQALHPEPGQP